LQLNEALRGQLKQDGPGQNLVNVTNDSVRTVLEQYLMLTLANKLTAAANNASGTMPSAVEGAATQHTRASTEEQLSVILRDLLQNVDEKIETDHGSNVNIVDPKPLASSPAISNIEQPNVTKPMLEWQPRWHGALDDATMGRKPHLSIRIE